MSQRAILLAVRDRLKQTVLSGGLGYTSQVCEVQFDGQPPPSLASEFFVSVHSGEWRFDGPCEGLEEVYGVDVTVTVRVGKVPQDRMGPNALVGPAGQSLDEKLEAIRRVLHLDPGTTTQYPLLALANVTINAAGSFNGFVEPLRFQSADAPQSRGPEWFSTDVDVQTRLPPAGLSQTLHFGGAKRIQHVETQT